MVLAYARVATCARDRQKNVSQLVHVTTLEYANRAQVFVRTPKSKLGLPVTTEIKTQSKISVQQQVFVSARRSKTSAKGKNRVKQKDNALKQAHVKKEVGYVHTLSQKKEPLVTTTTRRQVMTSAMEKVFARARIYVRTKNVQSPKTFAPY